MPNPDMLYLEPQDADFADRNVGHESQLGQVSSASPLRFTFARTQSHFNETRILLDSAWLPTQPCIRMVAAPTCESILRLYSTMLRTSRSFSSYNFREYFVGRTKDTFRQIQVRDFALVLHLFITWGRLLTRAPWHIEWEGPKEGESALWASCERPGHLATECYRESLIRRVEISRGEAEACAWKRRFVKLLLSLLDGKRKRFLVVAEAQNLWFM